MAGWIIAGVVVLFIAVIIIRTLTFVPKNDVEVDETPVEFDREAAVSNLRELVMCKTVSYTDHSREDGSEFKKLTDEKLPALFPHVYETCELLRPDRRCLLYHWKGKNPGDAAVMMAHYDVVPVDEEAWKKPAFDGIIEDGYLWGRGTIDTKASFNGVLSAADHLIANGFQPEHDIYFAFSGGEEVNGPGAAKIVEYFKKNRIGLSIVVDEGGAVVENVFPGVSKKAAMIGLAEKGMMNLEYIARSDGGHASAPDPHTPVGKLAMACAKVEAHPFKAKLSRPVKQMFDTLGRHSTFLYRMIFANRWCFGWVLSSLAKKRGGTMNALMRTTVAFTQMQGSKAENVIPPEARMLSNIRINPEENVQYVIDRIRRTIKDPEITVQAVVSGEPSCISTTECESWRKLATAVASTWKGCVVTPYLMTQASDSREYSGYSDKVYRFSAQDMTMEELETIHGNNERIRLDVIPRAVEFYIRLLRQF